MDKIVDARGLSCPQPVILTKKAMEGENGDLLTTIVDQTMALENVSKLASSQGYDYEVEEKDNAYYIHMSRTDEINIEKGHSTEDIAVLVSSRLFGQGNEELGQILMNSFLYTLNEMEENITHLLFMNSGIYLTVEGSPVIVHIKALESKGVEILSCGTCLDFYGLKEKLAVGKVTNMYTAMEVLCKASKTISV